MPIFSVVVQNTIQSIAPVDALFANNIADKVVNYVGNKTCAFGIPHGHHLSGHERIFDQSSVG